MATQATERRTTSGQYAPDAIQKAGANGEQTGQQTSTSKDVLHFGGYTFGSTGIFANGGTIDNPMGYPGYGTAYLGTYPTYRFMLDHPVVQLARVIRAMPVVSSSWEYAEGRTGVPESWVSDTRRVFDALRPRLVRDFYMRGCDFGWYGGEPIWEQSEGQYELVRVKPLLVDFTEILQDDYGNFVGLRSKNIKSRPVDLKAPFKSWKFTYEGESGYHYGRSWLENIRTTAWKDWLDCYQQLQRLASKITGIVTLIQSPAGDFPGPNGSRVTYADAAKQVIAGLAAGAAGAWYPSFTLAADSKGGVDMIQFLKEVAGKSLTKFEVLDFGKQADAITPILDRAKHDEDLIFAGALRSARTGLEATHGTKEEAGVHTDTGTMNAEAEDEEFGDAVQQLVDAHNVANHGPRGHRAVLLKPPSLIDRKNQTLKAFLMQLLNEPSIRIAAIRSCGQKGWKKMMSILDIPQEGTIELDDLDAGEKDGNVDNPEPQGGRPVDKTE